MLTFTEKSNKSCKSIQGIYLLILRDGLLKHLTGCNQVARKVFFCLQQIEDKTNLSVGKKLVQRIEKILLTLFATNDNIKLNVKPIRNVQMKLEKAKYTCKV